MNRDAVLTYLDLLEQTGLREEQSGYVQAIRDALLYPAETSQVERKHILVVDEDPVHQLFAKTALSTAGFRVTIAKDGEQALQIFQSQKPDLVVLEGQLPKLDGCQTAERMRKLEHGSKKIPILALTSHSIAGYAQRCLQVGMNEYIRKPTSSAELVSRVHFWLERGVHHS